MLLILVTTIFISFLATEGNVAEADSRFCLTGEHASGRWIPDTYMPDRKSFLCCGWDLEVDMLNATICPTEPQRNGQCIPMRQGAPQGLLKHSGGHSCRCDKVHGNANKSPRENWLWKPSNCDLLRWNATMFCSLLANRTVLMTGDSTMGQTAVTLMNMISYNGGDCGDKIHHVHSNYLTWRDMIKTCFLDNTIHTAHQEIKPNISIFTTGAHLQDVGDLDAIFFGLREFFRSESLRNVTLLWKTQNPGHYDCNLHKAPTDKPSNSVPKQLDKYHWNAHVEFDEYAKNHSKAYNIGIIDMSPLYLRADSHPGDEDCLHYCMPGPIDLFAVLLLQMLYNGEI